ncbi:hypothetical protein FAM09_22845 [Niastella caeni]|uniref:Tetratricopeptide repeat protein n=1 Tax=Niastella caeni TaxID=2569763 RepID=A0A4V4H017_9BACT|nr:hypothetical protein [Niastella caeni]THU34836.1 hypothetical protein FAM09_22845 [Niastella caeni]
MQYHIQTLVKHIFDKDSFEQVTVQELKQFTEDYPFAAVGQFLYAKKLKDSGSYNHYDQGEQASLYFHNALWLRWQLDHKEEAPALPVKAEEPAQQPGFRIVVQMPKTAPAIISTKPAVQPEENKEQETPVTETSAAAVAEPAEQNIQPAAVQTASEETAAAEQENGLKVNEDGSLVEHTPEPEQANTAPVQEEASAATETASAVAIAESSQLAEDSAAKEAAVNAVSITEEVLTPAASVAEVPEQETRGTEAVVVKEEADEIVPAVDVTAQEIALANEEIDDIVPAVEEAPPVEVITEVAETEVTATTEQATEEEPVVQVTETVAAEEQARFTAETEQPATTEEVVDNTTDRPSTDTVTEAPVQAEPEVVQTQPAQPTPLPLEGAGGRPDKTAVDLGEPIFESYHTIDYFASQGIKLGQADFKDKMGKQLKSFTDWLRSMKRIGPLESNTSLDEVTNQSIQRIAEHSVEEKEILTEAMAEVWAKQGNADKAIRVYEKLSLLNPAKSPYFAGRIEQLKAQ